MSITISSYNCESAASNVNLIESLLSNNDVLLLQETFLTNDNHSVLNQFGAEFDYAYVPAFRKNGTHVGRVSGGLAIIWRRISNVKYFPQYYTNRVMGLKIVLSSEVILLINVYMPCDYGDVHSLVDYKSTIVEIENLLSEESFDKLLIVGDFNCDPSRGRFYNELTRFMYDFSLCIRDVEILPDDSYSYISRSSISSTSWLDHIVTSSNCHPQNISIMYGFSVDDHIPICFTLNVDVALEYVSPGVHDDADRNNVNWDKVTDNDISNYSLLLDYLSEYCDSEFLSCNQNYCSDSEHFRKIEEMFNYVKDAVLFASVECLPIYSCFNSKTRRVVPGWNDYCRKAHDEARAAFLKWHVNGKIRNGFIFDNMKKTRSCFRRALSYCKLNELKIRREKFLVAFRIRNKYKFWREVKKINKVSSGALIDGNSNYEDIIALFDEKFRNILDDPARKNRTKRIISPMPDNGDFFRVYFHCSMIDSSISRLNHGQGFDDVHSKHLVYSGKIFRRLLSRVYSAMMMHSFIPKELLRGYIKPILKDGSICRTSSNNYRPIMNSSIFLKIFEYCLLPVLQRELRISCLQFGFELC